MGVYGCKLGVSWKNVGFSGFVVENRGFGGKMGVLVEKWGFRGFLVKKSGKSREEPGI